MSNWPLETDPFHLMHIDQLIDQLIDFPIWVQHNFREFTPGALCKSRASFSCSSVEEWSSRTKITASLAKTLRCRDPEHPISCVLSYLVKLLRLCAPQSTLWMQNDICVYIIIYIYIHYILCIYIYIIYYVYIYIIICIYIIVYIYNYMYVYIYILLCIYIIICICIYIYIYIICIYIYIIICIYIYYIYNMYILKQPTSRFAAQVSSR